MGPGPPGSVIATKSDNQSKIAQQRKRIRPGTTARGVTIFHFFQKYNSRRPCDTVTSNAHIDSVHGVDDLQSPWPQIYLMRVTAPADHGHFDPAVGLRWPVVSDSRSWHSK